MAKVYRYQAYRWADRPLASKLTSLVALVVLVRPSVKRPRYFPRSPPCVVPAFHHLLLLAQTRASYHVVSFTTGRGCRPKTHGDHMESTVASSSSAAQSIPGHALLASNT